MDLSGESPAQDIKKPSIRTVVFGNRQNVLSLYLDEGTVPWSKNTKLVKSPFDSDDPSRIVLGLVLPEHIEYHLCFRNRTRGEATGLSAHPSTIVQ